MLSADNIMQLLQSLIWLLAGVGIFIVGMNFMSEALEKSAGEGMKRLLGKISNNRFSGVGIGAGVTAIIQSSSATSVMVIGLVNAGVMTLMQATPIIMGANIGTTITGVLVALKNDYFNMLMYLFAFAGVMMGFFKQEKVKLIQDPVPDVLTIHELRLESRVFCEDLCQKRRGFLRDAFILVDRDADRFCRP